MPKVSRPLTDHVVKQLRPTRDQKAVREITDGGCRGLLLRLTPRGEKTWFLRTTINGRRVWHKLGAYPQMTLAEARKRTEAYLSAAADGDSPAEVEAREKSEKMTVAGAHAQYLDTMRDLRPGTLRLKRTMFRDHIGPVVGHRLIRTIRKAEVIEVTAAVSAKGFPVQANRVFSEFMALLRWCHQHGFVASLPAVQKKDMRAIAGAAKEQKRRRTLTEREIVAAWRAVPSLGPLSSDFLRLLILTGQRRDEVRLMEWSEVDLESALWTIPAARYKTGITHVVPLSRQALEILKGRWQAGATGPVLAGRDPSQAFNGAQSATRRLQEAMGGASDFVLHDLRRTVRTGLARLGTDEVTAEMVIGHMPQGIQSVYDQHDRLEERRNALQKWADYVERLADADGNVVPLVTRPSA